MVYLEIFETSFFQNLGGKITSNKFKRVILHLDIAWSSDLLCIALFKRFMLVLEIEINWILSVSLSLMRACNSVGLRMTRSISNLKASRFSYLDHLF